jgi:CBS domain containing-hemolysin-like protein
MRLFYVSAKPFVDFFNWLGNLVLKPFGVPPAREVGHAPHSEDELRLLLEQSLGEGLIDSEERQFAENVFVFGDRRARQIMVPRPEVSYVTTDEGVRDAAARVVETGHTRLPLCDPDGGLDAPVGLVNAKDLLRALVDGEAGTLLEVARPLKRVSESFHLDELLHELRHERQHAALVVDEHGTTIGFVTLEDILEEIVGEISDEFDRATEVLVSRRAGEVAFKGNAPVDLVVDELGIAIADSHEATIGGHVLERLGRLPEPGELVDVDGRTVRVEAVDDARITELVFLTDEAPAPGLE